MAEIFLLEVSSATKQIKGSYKSLTNRIYYEQEVEMPTHFSRR